LRFIENTVAASKMTPGKRDPADEGDRLRDLAHLASAVGHHVINAFSAAVSSAELIRTPGTTRNDPVELANLGTAIVETAIDASQVTRRLISWARQFTAIDTEFTGHPPELVDLNDLIKCVIESEAGRSNSRVTWSEELTSIPMIKGDRRQLRAMLVNLVQNARDAMPGGRGAIHFTTQSDARGMVFLTIRDSGCGMSPDVLRRATEPFFSTKPDQDGIGLTVAQGIWRRHHGSMAIESSPSQGTTIRLSVGPIAAEPAPSNPAVRPEA
jgi:signal transduction histidine kinase